MAINPPRARLQSACPVSARGNEASADGIPAVPAASEVQKRFQGRLMNLSTRYLGLTLAHPFMAGASPLARDLDHAKRLEDGGAAAIVLHSLFEEQITLRDTGQVHQMDPADAADAAVLASYPAEGDYLLDPDAYLDHLRRVKAALKIPVIGSLNGVTGELWLKAAAEIAQAGADGLELNMYEVAADPDDSGNAIEGRIRNATAALKSILTIPVAIKLSPYFTAFGHFAHQLDAAGADGLVLFNRFYQPDIDLATLTASPRIELSTSAELLLRLRWIAALRGRVHTSLGLSGGVATAEDGIKAVLAGADAVQIVSAVLRNGPHFFKIMHARLVSWMTAHEFTSIDEVRGRVRFAAGTDDGGSPARAGYLRTLQSWPDID
jgi:dihydroorotate dehydrogenase (fumarate)